MEGIYDALEPFTEKYSKIWRLVVYTCAVLAGYNENKSIYVPSEVQDEGVLEYLMHVEPIVRTINKIDRAIIILSF